MFESEYIAIWKKCLRILAFYTRECYNYYKGIALSFENRYFEYNVKSMNAALLDESLRHVSWEKYRGLENGDEDWDSVKAYAKMYVKNFIFSCDHSSPWQEFSPFDFLKEFLCKLKFFKKSYDFNKSLRWWSDPEEDKAEQITDAEWNGIMSAMRD